jgi:prepilin-type N-terminal cleavage/methylation domain-containing protein
MIVDAIRNKSFLAKSRKSSGFTIVELLIVIVVIGILAAITIVAYNGIQQRARMSSATSALSQAAKKIAVYQVDNPGQAPPALSDAGVYDGGGVIYKYTAAANGIYCVTASVGITSYKITNTSSTPSQGICTGHSAEGYITNMIPNPSFESNLVDSAWNVSTVNRSTAWASNGSYSTELIPNSTTSNDSFIILGGSLGGIRLNMESGKSYTVSGTINLPAAQTGTLSGQARRIVVYYKVGAGSYQSFSSNAAPNAAGTNRLSLNFTLPAGITEAFIRFYNGALQGGGTVYWDSLVLNEGNNTNYVDGFTPGWSWSGADNNSVSSGPTP